MARPKFCESCGKPLELVGRFCEACGQPIEAGASTVPTAPVSPPPAPAFAKPPAVQPATTPPAVPVALQPPTRGAIKLIAATVAVVGVLILCGIAFFLFYRPPTTPAQSLLPAAAPDSLQITANTQSPVVNQTPFAVKQAQNVLPPGPKEEQPSQPPVPPTVEPAQPAPQPLAALPTSQTRDVFAIAAEAQQWVDRGYAQEKAANLQEALTDYEKAQSIFQDTKLADHIRQLKKTLSSASPPQTSAVDVTPKMLQSGKTLYSCGNTYAVENGAKRANTFVVSEPTLVTYIMTYHWNNGRGKTPGSIALEHEDGTKYGGWNAAGINGQGGVPNAGWVVIPGVVIKPGKYIILDSHPSTWSQNAATGGQGICEIKGLPWRQAKGQR